MQRGLRLEEVTTHKFSNESHKNKSNQINLSSFQEKCPIIEKIIPSKKNGFQGKQECT